MSANAKAQKILKELSFDFATFTMGEFLRVIEEKKGREIIATPWEMPPAMFGAWISDSEEPREYIFYRNNISEAHQIHVQLHELSHFIFGHPTLKINRKMIAEAVAGAIPLPFSELLQRSPNSVDDMEKEAETLTNLIQKQVIRNSKIDNLLIHDTPSQEKLSNFLKRMSLI